MNSDPYVTRWQSERYTASHLQFTLPVQPTADAWLARLHLTNTSKVIDLGCGEGKVLVALAPYIQQGIGIDGSLPMLVAARRYAQRHGVTNLEFLQADFRHLVLVPGIADAVISQYALHHISDAEKATVLASIHTILRPDGLFYMEDDTFNFPP